MTFLAPNAGLIAGLIAGPTLLLLYLLKLRRRPVRVSTTIFWEQAARDLQVNAPFRWLKPSILFFLHLLMVGLLVLAIARPAVDAAFSGASRVIIVIDRSASMAAKDAPSSDSRLDEAKERAGRMLTELAGGGISKPASVALVTFAAEPRTLVGLTNDLRLVRDEIANITPTDQPADLAAAFKTVAALLAEGSQEGGDTPVIVVLSDGGPIIDAGHTSQPLAGTDLRFVRVGPVPKAVVPGEPVQFTGHDNTGIVSLAARRDDRSPSTCHVFVRLANARATPTTQVVTLSLAGKEIAKRPVTVPASTATEIGSAAETFDVIDPGMLVLTAALADASDLLPADDVASVLVRPAMRPRVLFVSAGGTTASTGISAEGFLTDVLLELGLERFEQITPERLNQLLAASPTLPCDLLILDRVSPPTLPPVPTLAFAASLPAPGLGFKPADGASPTYALTWKRTHPTLRDIALDTLYVARSGTFDDAKPADEAAIDDLARGTRGSLIRESQVGGIRRLSLAFAVADCNWPLQPGFAIFLSATIEYLSGNLGDQSAQAWTTAAAVPLSIPAGTEDRLTLSGPTEWATPLRTPRAERSVVGVGPLERAGVYTIGSLAGGQATPPLIAVNLANERESGLATNDHLDFAGRPITARNAGGAESGPSELWPWLVAAVGILALAEWLIFGLKSRV